MVSLLDRISGALLGGLCGDAIGRPTECLDYRVIAERFGRITGPRAERGKPAGAGTDDSALKHLLCDAILRAEGEVTPREWAAVWRERMRPDDYWIPVQNAYFKLMVEDVPPEEVGVGNMVSNSSAMCISPVGIVNAGDPGAACREALSVARLIHRGFPLEAAGAVAAAVAAALGEGVTPETVVIAATAHLPAGSEMIAAIEAGVDLARESDGYDEFRVRFYDRLLRPWPHRHDGWSTAVDPRESVPAALGILLIANGDPVETILGCANFGRDADTIATIGGGIAGALGGASALPGPWIEAVQAATPVEQEALAASLLGVLARRAEHAAAWGRVFGTGCPEGAGGVDGLLLVGGVSGRWRHPGPPVACRDVPTWDGRVSAGVAPPAGNRHGRYPTRKGIKVMTPSDYAERVYAGVLGKIIGVYLGRPIESWPYERIVAEHGEVDRYLPGRDGAPLVVTDDDISGTFAFLRALPDHGNDPALTPAQIGETWLNYIVERRAILWWGGIGNSTEHTAYLRLKHGAPAPQSGSIARNGKTIAEQIGSQIFIDGWAMVCPGDPERAADFARRAASVSHDGEAIYGAQVVAAMEAQAFVESDLNRLLDTAVGLIPADSTIRRLIDDVREWHAREPDWRQTRELIAGRYGYDKYGGNCHMVPNHALIIHSLLHGEDDFRRSLMIVNTSGWDTDCNSGNVGCLLGIKNGLAGIDASDYDWRGPVADRLYLATADGGRGISDAATETYHVVNIGRALAGEEPVAPKRGARFGFELPGAVQGFQAEDPDTVTVENLVGHSAGGERSLAIRARGLAPGQPARVATPTFVPPEAIEMPGYTILASPTLYPGQTVRLGLAAAAANVGSVACRPFVRVYGAEDALRPILGPAETLGPGARAEIAWTIEPTGGAPIAEVGLEVAPTGSGEGTVYLDFVTWDGTPDVTFDRPEEGGTIWRRAWVDAVDHWGSRWPEPYRIVQNEGTGLISQGTAEWTDYRVSAPVTFFLARAGGIAARVGGLRRYYALLLGDDGRARLVKARDGETVLAEMPFDRHLDRPYELALEAIGARLRAWVDDRLLFEVEDRDDPLTAGGVGLVVTEGCLGAQAVRVEPAG